MTNFSTDESSWQSFVHSWILESLVFLTSSHLDHRRKNTIDVICDLNEIFQLICFVNSISSSHCLNCTLRHRCSCLWNPISLLLSECILGLRTAMIFSYFIFLSVAMYLIRYKWVFKCSHVRIHKYYHYYTTQLLQDHKYNSLQCKNLYQNSFNHSFFIWACWA